MEYDLEKSLLALEDAISLRGKSLLSGSAPENTSKKKRKDGKLTLSSMPEEGVERTFNNFGPGSTYSDTGTFMNVPWKGAIDNLHMEFYEVLQSHSNEAGIFDVVADMERCCTNLLQVMQKMKVEKSYKICLDEEWIEKERNIWKLVFVLYQDRLAIQGLMEEENDSVPLFGSSEKECAVYFFKTVGLLRESQLIIDWLESIAAEKDNEIVHFSDTTVGWENTLHQLKSVESIVFESSRKIVTQMHPDAPHYQGLSLHDMDMEDDKRLCRRIFTEIRCGKLQQAEKLAVECGHGWRAAILEGWKLFHNPNVKIKQDKTSNKQSPKENRSSDSLPAEGNPDRDLWKATAYESCQQEHLDMYEKASLAAYCGHLEALLNVCSTWEDYLWAYMRVLVDIRVESEIRDNIAKEYMPMPDSYWNKRTSINDVFQRLETSYNDEIRNTAKDPHHVIQKFLVLDELPQMIRSIGIFIEDPDVSTQFLRFVAHLVLFFEQIGLVNERDVAEKIIEAFVMRLIDMKETQLVAFYVSKLSSEKQVNIFASYLEQIIDNGERKEALCFAEDCGLPTQVITKRVVENIRKLPHEVTTFGDLQKRITENDLKKISALDWLLIYDAQKLEALSQCNAVIFAFLTLQKTDAAQLAFNKIPSDAIDKVLSEGEILPSTNEIIKEHLSYKSYLNAQEAFSEWFKQFNAKPIPPEAPNETASFTEKVAYQHRLSQFKAETDRWKLASTHMAKVAKTMLYNVLLFPDGGWLTGAKDGHYLRSICIPEVTLLLYSVLYESGYHEENVQLADILASEKYCIYKAFSREKIGEVLIKLSESSVALLNNKKDAWGNEV